MGRVALHIVPRARDTAVAGSHGDAVKIRVAAPPVDGAANAELVRFLAARLNVPAARVDQARRDLADADALLVVGSSLMVYSGYRFVLAARALGRPVAAINLGRTRADDLLDCKIVGDCASVLATALA